MSDIDLIHVEKEMIVADGRRVGGMRLKNGGNVLTNIEIEEDRREQGLGGSAVRTWLENCKRDGFEKAYVVNVNHVGMDKIIKSLHEYEVSGIRPRDVPAEVKAGPHINHDCYEIKIN